MTRTSLFRLTVPSLALGLLSACSGKEPGQKSGPAPREAPAAPEATPISRTVDAGSACEGGGRRIDVGRDVDGNGSLEDAEVTGSRLECDGLASRLLVLLDDVVGSPECPSGGVRARAGNDANGNGQLEDGEIVTDAIRCSRIASVRVRVEPLSPGGTCRYGGSRIWTGDDVNGDGVLNGTDAAKAVVVCNVGTARRIRSGPSTSCAATATLVELGPDENDDGVLSDDEVVDSETVCGTHLAGDLVLDDGADVAGARDLVAIEGDLVIGRNISFVTLPALRILGGRLRVEDRPALRGLELPELRNAGGLTNRSLPLDIRAPSLTTLTLGKLESFAGDILIEAGAGLRALDLGALRTVRRGIGSVSVIVDGASVTLGAEALRFLNIEGASAVTLPHLRTADSVNVTSSATGTVVRAPALEAVKRSLSLTGTGIATLEAPSLTRAMFLQIEKAPLRELRLEALAEVDELWIHEAPVLAGLDLPALTRAKSIDIENAPALKRCEVERIVTRLAAPPVVRIVGTSDAACP